MFGRDLQFANQPRAGRVIVLYSKQQIAMEDKNHSRYFVPGLATGLAVLQMFSARRPVLRVTDISNELGITRSAAFRLAYTLEHLGFLQKYQDTKKYQLSARVLGLGFAYLSSLGIVESTRTALIDLSEELNVSTHLVLRDRLEVVYVARYSANNHIASNVHIGTRFPVHATAPGQVLLADLTDEAIAEALSDADMMRYTSHTPTTADNLLRRVGKARKQGYLVSWGYFEKGLVAVALPIRDSSGLAMSAINITCPIAQFSRKEFDRIVVRRAREVAGTLSRRLGYQE